MPVVTLLYWCCPSRYPHWKKNKIKKWTTTIADAQKVLMGKVITQWMGCTTQQKISDCDSFLRLLLLSIELIILHCRGQCVFSGEGVIVFPISRPFLKPSLYILRLYMLTFMIYHSVKKMECKKLRRKNCRCSCRSFIADRCTPPPPLPPADKISWTKLSLISQSSSNFAE